jgi:UDP-N-acetylmuramoyl-tripeptide--D-alanyl-D-alanine ligase
MNQLIKQLSPTSFCTDSRLVKSGSLFFALKGEKVDAHTFLPQVAELGAIGAVVQENYTGPSYGPELYRVKDVLGFLQQLAKEWIVHCRPRIVAVTGSVGKTTTKEFISTLLKGKYRVATSPGNSNSQVGLPLSVLNNLKESDQILVQEMAMTEAGQISKLISIAPPEVAVITMVALVHACNFASLREIALAKGEVFGHKETKLGILLRDLEDFDELCRMGNCRKESFSLKNPEADYFMDRENRLGKKREVCLGELPVPGDHNRQNLLAAIAVARYFSLEWDEIVQAIGLLALPERRLQFVEKKGVQFVNDAYNASTVSMKASFQSLPKPKEGFKTIAVLGEMLELGPFSGECHREVGEASLAALDSVICYGKECQPIVACWEKAERPVKWTCDWNELIQMVRDVAKPGDVVLLKGSRAKELWKVVEQL